LKAVAVLCLILGKAEVLEESDKTTRSLSLPPWVKEPVSQSKTPDCVVTVTWRLPSVIRVLHRISGRKRTVKFSRQNMYTRDQGRCQYCGVVVSHTKATYDHVVPRSKGGKTRWENIVIACHACNQKKASRTPEEAGMILRKKPIRPTKPADVASLTLAWHDGMPPSWRQWIRDQIYWTGELESD
jgi:5-methylcytosine-specific restriction endonuclease McrA